MSEGLELFPVAIGTYTDPRLEALEVDAEVAQIAAALAAFDAERVDWDTPAHQRTSGAVNARLNEWAKSTRPQTILYWVGHGWSDGRDHTLAHAGSPRDVGTEGVTTQRIAAAIATRAMYLEDVEAEEASWMIVVVDACQSAAFVRELKTEIGHRAPDTKTGYLLIGGLSGQGATNLGCFSRELRFFLHTARRSDDTIPVSLMAQHFEGLRAEVEQKWLLKEVVLRRRYSTLVNLDLDTQNQLLAALDTLTDDERQHFLQKAYGGERPFPETMLGEQSWYFQGRHDETRRISEWLERADTGMLIVTGPVGSGKSALLGHLVVHANPALRTALHRTGLIQPPPPGEQPPDNVFDAVLHLTGATSDEVVDRLAGLTEDPDAYGLASARLFGLDSAVNHLIKEITRTRRRVTILVDALDEAVDPLFVASRILAVLAETSGVRVVTGTRASTHEFLDRPATNTDVLDALRVAHTTTLPITADATAVADYVSQRLHSSQTALLDPFGTEIDIESLVASVRRREPHFLFARLLVLELLADPKQRTVTAWARLLEGEHQSLFETAVARLTTDQPALLAVFKALAFARGRGLPAADNIWMTAAQALTSDPTTKISNTDDVVRLTEVAAAYVLMDREHDQTVYRLAHRTFSEHFTKETEPTATDQHNHLAITDALIATASEHIEQVLTGTRSLNPYYTHYLPAHAAAAGESGWRNLDPHTALLLALDPAAVAINTWRSSSGQYQLPDTIAAITILNTHLQGLEPRDRYLPIHIERHRHTTTPDTAAPLPSWVLPIIIGTTANSPSPPHRILTGHSNTVRVLASVVADGRTLLASADDDGTVRLWDPATGSPRPLIEDIGAVRHLVSVNDPGPVRALVSVVVADGRTLLASTGDDRTVRLWDPVNGRYDGEPLKGHDGTVRALVPLVMADGRTLLASAGDDGMVQLWDPATGRPHGRPHGVPTSTPRWAWPPVIGHAGAVRALVSVKADGRTLVAFAGDDGAVRLWPVSGRPHGKPLTGHTGAVRALVSVVTDGRTLLASAGDDSTVRLWDPATARPHGKPLTGHTGAVLALVALVADGRTLLASAGAGRTVRLWDPATARPHGKPLTGHTGAVLALVSVELPDGRTLLASSGFDGTVRLWDPATARPYGEPLTGHTGAVLALVSVVADGRTLLASAGDDRTVRLWDPPIDLSALGSTRPKSPTREVGSSQIPGQISVVALAPVKVPDGRTLLASIGDDHTVRLWDPDTGKPHGKPLTGHTRTVRAIASLKTGGRTVLASVGDDGTVRLWDPATGHGKLLKQRWPRRRQNGHTGAVLALMSVVADGRTLLATAGGDGTVRLWDPATGIPHGKPLTGHVGPVLALASVKVPDGRTLLASAGDDGTVRLWDPVTGRPHGDSRHIHARHIGPARALVAVELPDGRTLLASGGVDGRVRFWDPVTGLTPGRYGTYLIGHRGTVRALASLMAPDGRTLLASAGDDGTVELLALTNSDAFPWHTLEPGPAPIVALHSIGDRLAVATQSSIIVLQLHRPPNTPSQTEAPER